MSVHLASKACKGPALLSGNSRSLSSGSHSGGSHSGSSCWPQSLWMGRECRELPQTGCRHQQACCADQAFSAGLDESECVDTGSSGSPCSSRQAFLPLTYSSRISRQPSGSSEGEGFHAKAGAA